MHNLSYNQALLTKAKLLNQTSMSVREENKQKKRVKIVQTAKKIIKKDGMEKLTMRHLADVAEMSSRTPYNLFESKTDILVALLYEELANTNFMQYWQDNDDELVLAQLVSIIEHLGELYATDNDFYRSVLWGIMSADDIGARDRAVTAITELISPVIQSAVDQKELVPTLSITALSTHLLTLLFAIIGMWGGSQLTLQSALIHIQLSWCNALTPFIGRKSKTWLQELTAQTQQALEQLELEQ